VGGGWGEQLGGKCGCFFLTTIPRVHPTAVKFLAVGKSISAIRTLGKSIRTPLGP
jgi:hypothetical protein